jgi:hypothetical protein
MSFRVVRLLLVITCSFVASPALSFTDPDDSRAAAADAAAVNHTGTSDYAGRVALATSSLDDAAVRTHEPLLASMLTQAALHSPSFQALLDRLRASDLVVYVRTRFELPQMMHGQLTFVGDGGGRRYLLIDVAWGLMDDNLVAALAHELQHAVEVAERPDIVDTASLGRAYESFGIEKVQRIGKTFETQRAIDTGKRVRAEFMTIRRNAIKELSPDLYSKP